MPITQQRLHKIEFQALKNLASFTLDIEPKNVTGIFGINGCGKSSILYSLLCLFRPSERDMTRRNFKFNQFFTHTTHSKFTGSSFKITHSFRQDEATVNNNVERQYLKAGRWKPRYEDRPQRDVYFVGISSCVPEIELEKSESLIRLTTANLTDALSTTIRQNAEIVLNRQYSEYNSHNYNARNKKFIGVRHNNISYSSLSMGAGEQRTFKILDTVFRAENYSLIIIDEIDLTLHTEALNRLIEIIVARASAKNLQIVFTSHREEITQRMDINIRHIHQIGTHTICFNETNPDCISRLTGNQIRPLEIFVEDDLAEVTVQKVIEELQIRRHCSIKRYGAIDNSFSLATGMFLKGENLANILILLDGDNYRTGPERMTQMKKYFSGTEATAIQNRETALACIKQLVLHAGIPPEVFINTAIRQLADNTEVTNAALSINAATDKHDFVNRIVTTLGYQDKTQGLIKVIDKLATTTEWTTYTQELRDWLNERITTLSLTL
jgi:ABC-type lipoprotein export system ATPase subunit